MSEISIEQAERFLESRVGGCFTPESRNMYKFIMSVLKESSEKDKRIAELRAERDAAVGCLKQAVDSSGECYGCKWYDVDERECSSDDGRLMCDANRNNMWQWRGSREASSNTPDHRKE